MTNKLAIIGGTGLSSLMQLEVVDKQLIDTPYGEPSGYLQQGRLCGDEVVFIARHGDQNRIVPHKINYRANIWALKQLQVSHIIAVAAVGGIALDLQPGMLVIPDQIIDYTYSRESSFFADQLSERSHVDFTKPYCQSLRQLIVDVAVMQEIALKVGGVYAATQGPRLETAAEIDRLENDGCTVVGMTAMPEAVLAKELDLCYAAINVVVNKAAGRSKDQITLKQIHHYLQIGLDQVQRLISQIIGQIAQVN